MTNLSKANLPTKEAALYNFWASFGLPAYEENSLHGAEFEPKFPYITYEVITDDWWGNSPIQLSASLWYRSPSWLQCNDKSREISRSIGDNGHRIQCDEGLIWINKAHGFAKSMGDSSDDMIKRKALSIEVNYYTRN